MAWVNVEGVVSRLHNSGGGFSVEEKWQAQGQDRKRFWAVFPGNPVQVTVGDRVKVAGGLQTKTTEPKADGRVFVDHTVGQAKVEIVQGAPAQDSWVPQQDSFSGEQPF